MIHQSPNMAFFLSLLLFTATTNSLTITAPSVVPNGTFGGILVSQAASELGAQMLAWDIAHSPANELRSSVERDDKMAVFFGAMDTDCERIFTLSDEKLRASFYSRMLWTNAGGVPEMPVEECEVTFEGKWPGLPYVAWNFFWDRRAQRLVLVGIGGKTNAQAWILEPGSCIAKYYVDFPLPIASVLDDRRNWVWALDRSEENYYLPAIDLNKNQRLNFSLNESIALDCVWEQLAYDPFNDQLIFRCTDESRNDRAFVLDLRNVQELRAESIPISEISVDENFFGNHFIPYNSTTLLMTQNSYLCEYEWGKGYNGCFLLYLNHLCGDVDGRYGCVESEAVADLNARFVNETDSPIPSNCHLKSNPFH